MAAPRAVGDRSFSSPQISVRSAVSAFCDLSRRPADKEREGAGGSLPLSLTLGAVWSSGAGKERCGSQAAKGEKPMGKQGVPTESALGPITEGGIRRRWESGNGRQWGLQRMRVWKKLAEKLR